MVPVSSKRCAKALDTNTEFNLWSEACGENEPLQVGLGIYNEAYIKFVKRLGVEKRVLRFNLIAYFSYVNKFFCLC